MTDIPDLTYTGILQGQIQARETSRTKVRGWWKGRRRTDRGSPTRAISPARSAHRRAPVRKILERGKQQDDR